MSPIKLDFNLDLCVLYLEEFKVMMLLNVLLCIGLKPKSLYSYDR